MDKESLAFIEKMELFGHATGMPRSLARVIGYLLICEPVTQSAKDIQETLKLSTGTVSNVLAVLRSSGMARPVSVPGMRSMLYEIDSSSWKRNAIHRLKASSQALEVAGEGLQLKPGNDRVRAMYRLYEVFDREADVLIAKLEEIK
ncbi:MAG TPA: hypothetical protein VLG36_00670 [Candidatus Chromulinivoraceae bacterium]|nr:hypothetical protein [Candidatus Chromulinivoraceae bacterium]